MCFLFPIFYHGFSFSGMLIGYAFSISGILAWVFYFRYFSIGFCPPQLFLPATNVFVRCSYFCPTQLFLPTTAIFAHHTCFCPPHLFLPAAPIFFRYFSSYAFSISGILAWVFYFRCFSMG